MRDLDNLDILYAAWAILYQVVLVMHFAVRKRLFESYTAKYGWIIYALAIPAVAISIILLLGGKAWWYWLGGFLCVVFSAYGYWVDYVKGIPWRTPFLPRIGFPYVTFYLSTVMFYWWPLARLGRPLWIVAAALFVVGTILNIRSH
jgi:hypothetical protein